MKTNKTVEVNLYSVFENEKARHGEDMTVSYNNKNQQLTYKLEGEGSLTVKVGRDKDNDNREDFYFAPEGRPDDKELVFVVAGNGEARRFEDLYASIPEEFQKVIEGYCDKEQRKEIGIDAAQAEAKQTRAAKKQSFGRD